MYLPPRAKYFRENSLISPQQRRPKGSGTITGTKCQSAKYSRPPHPHIHRPLSDAANCPRWRKKISKKGDHIKISTSWRRLNCSATSTLVLFVAGWVSPDDTHCEPEAHTHNLISYWQHISDKKLSMPRESSHNHNFYSTLQSFENKSPLFSIRLTRVTLF